MSYKDHEVIEVRKVRWDMLWHVVYISGKNISWDRVTKAEALRVAQSKRTKWGDITLGLTKGYCR